MTIHPHQGITYPYDTENMSEPRLLSLAWGVFSPEISLYQRQELPYES